MFTGCVDSEIINYPWNTGKQILPEMDPPLTFGDWNVESKYFGNVDHRSKQKYSILKPK